jgi:DNA invertase Pin-like site-specific DNA recombinase
MKRAALYLRVSTVDQHPETQLHDLRGLAAQRGFQIVQEYTDRISGVKARRPGLDQLLADIRRGKIDVVMGRLIASPAPPGTSSRFSTNCPI